jgi:hypothetical protein
MPRYEVTMLVEFIGEIEAESIEKAEELAVYDQTCSYQGVFSIEVAELEGSEEY